MMKKILSYLSVMLLTRLLLGVAMAAPGFTDSYVQFYGEVRQIAGGQTILLQSGQLEMTFVNQSDPTNRVTLSTELTPTGPDEIKPWSYSLKVPLAYLPEATRIDEFLSIRASSTNFKIEEIKINGTSATLPDGSKEFYGLSFASRASDYRLDLLIEGDSTDTDGDGLPDWWEELYGLNPNLADSNTDFDNDGWSNLEEFRRGSNPTISNRVPQLATVEVSIPESGEAGLYLQILDSDTPNEGIGLTLSGIANGGFDIKLDGVVLPSGESQNFQLTDLQSGRLTISHQDRSVSELALPLTWNDGGDPVSGELYVRVATPSTQDGNDSSLWLDGMDLSANGSQLSVWNDRSGNGRNASQPLPDHQPVVADHSADFSSSKSAHLFFNDVAFPLGNHTVLAAYRAAASADAPQTMLSTNRGFLDFAPTTQAVSYPGAPSYQMDGLAVSGYENTSGKNVTSIFRREGSVLENIFGISYDGESSSGKAIDPVLPTLGARRSAISSGGDPVDQSFNGQIQELLVFPTALAEQKLRDVHDYLHSKWGEAVIWDFSTGLRTVNLNAVSATQQQIIRGGHGDDELGGGPLDDTLSGGPGDDVLTGGDGIDRFVFGGVDVGKDIITDYDMAQDIIDLSALFWGMSGDARNHISIRLDTDFSTEVPTLDSVLIVNLQDGGTQEIVLKNRVLGSTQLIQLIGEGRIRMGGLTVPSGVEIALAPGASSDPTEPFDVVVTRSGDGTAAAYDVPLGFFNDALGGHFIVDGATSNESHRSVIHFARGELSKTLTIRPLPDLDASGPADVEVAVLPQYKYAIGGASVQRTVSDHPIVRLEVIQANAVSDIAQSASIRVHRDGALDQNLNVNLHVGGTAKPGVHILSVPNSITIPAGQSSTEIQITAIAEGLVNGPKVVLIKLLSRNHYQLGDPREAVLYAAATLSEANSAGFDRWLQASTQGAVSSLADLKNQPKEVVNQYLQAYAFGLDSVNELGKQQVKFRIVDGRPELIARGAQKAADVRWGVESSSSLGEWSDATSNFTEATESEGLKFLGGVIDPAKSSGFFRLNMKLDPGVLTSTTIDTLTNASRTGITGNADWTTDQASGDLVSSGSTAGEISRILAEVGATESLDFEMEIAGAGADDLLIFYVDGVKQAETTGAAVRVQLNLTGADPHLLMWEFKRGTGNAVIRDLAP